MWTLNRDESFEFLDAYANLFDHPVLDTADSYVQWVNGKKGGESETVIGDWLSRSTNRKSIFLCTKIGKKMDRQGLGYQNIISATYESLRRLQTDYVDLLMLHSWIDGANFLEVVRALEFLQKNGALRYFGVSNFPQNALKIIHEELLARLGVGISFVQYHYNLIERDSTKIIFDNYSSRSNFGFESDILPWVEENDVILMPYHPLARGFLSEKYLNDSGFENSIHSERVKKYLNFNVTPLLSELKELSDKYNSQIPNIALAWLNSRGKYVLPVVSFSSVEQMTNLSTQPILELDDINTLTRLSCEIA